MGLSRRFLNVIVNGRILGLRSLRRIDLARQQFFNPGPPPPLNGNGSAADADSEVSKMDRIHLPHPIITFRASAADDELQIHCLPLTESNMLCADQSGRTFLFDADTRHVMTMPSLHKPKFVPLSLFIPSAASDNDSNAGKDFQLDDEEYDEDGVGTLFVMEASPNMELGYTDQTSDQFEAYTYGQRKRTVFKTWKCQPLPPPPYLRDPMWRKFRPEITSYAVVGGGTQILISAEGVGTFCMDTATHTWSPVGKWMLPLYGKIEYVPELNLWFGLSAKFQLSAADLSNLDSKPRLVGTWKQEFDPPEDWELMKQPQLVNMGSGRFCIARFFNTTVIAGRYYDKFIDRTFGVITGVEVVPRVHTGNGNGSANGGSDNGIASSNCNGSNGNASNNCNGSNGHGNSNGNGNGGKVKLRMIKHKSRCRTATNCTFIESVF